MGISYARARENEWNGTGGKEKKIVGEAEHEEGVNIFERKEERKRKECEE